MFIVSYEDEECNDENGNVEANEEFAPEVLDVDTKQEVIDTSSSRFFLHRKVYKIIQMHWRGLMIKVSRSSDLTKYLAKLILRHFEILSKDGEVFLKWWIKENNDDNGNLEDTNEELTAAKTNFETLCQFG